MTEVSPTASVPQVNLTAEFERLIRRCALLERRREEEAAEAREQRENLAAGLLEVCDALDEILRGQLNEDQVARNRDLDPLHENVKATRRLLTQKLERAGVRRIPLSRVANPEYCETVETLENADLPPDTVLQEISSGYLLDEHLLRPARVIVSIPPTGPSEEE